MLRKIISYTLIFSMIWLEAAPAMKRSSLVNEKEDEREERQATFSKRNSQLIEPKQPDEETPLLLETSRDIEQEEEDIEKEEESPSNLNSINILKDFVQLDPDAEDHQDLSLRSMEGLFSNRDEPDFKTIIKKLQRIENRPFIVKWGYLNHLGEKILYALWLRQSDIEGRLGKGCCKSRALWIEGYGMPLATSFTAARHLTGFRQGVDFFVKNSLSLILTGLLGYQLYEQIDKGTGFKPLEVLKVIWKGDDTSIRGALSFLVHPAHARYFFSLFALPVVWGIGNAMFFARRGLQDTAENFQKAVKAVNDFCQPKNRKGCGGFWRDKVRWLLPFYQMGTEVNYILYRLLLDGNLSLEERRAGFEAILNFAKETTGYAKIEGLFALQRLAFGTSSKQLSLVEDAYGKPYKERLLKEKAWALEELQKQNPGIRKAGLGGFIHNLYAHYLLWEMGVFAGPSSALALAVYKLGKLALSVNFLVQIAQQIINYLNCPKPLQKGFTYGMREADYYSAYDAKCLQAYLDNFNKIPGQPANTTIVKILPLFKNLDPSQFTTLNFTGRGVTGQQVGDLLRGFQHYQPKIVFTTLDLSNNNIGATTGDMEALVSAFSSSLIYLDLSGNDIGASGSAVVLGQTLLNFPQLKVLKLSNNNPFNQEYKGAVEIGNGLRSLPHLRIFDMSWNFIGYHDGPNGIVAIENSLPFLTNLEKLDLSQNAIGWHLSNATQVLANGLPSLVNLKYLGLSGTLSLSTDKNSAVALMKSLQYLKKLRTLKFDGMFTYSNTSTSNITFALAESLSSLQSLTNLGLEYANIGCSEDESVAALANSFRFCSSLESLELFGNCIGKTGPNGTITLASALGSLKKLQDLDLELNYIGSTDPNSAIPVVNSILQLPKLNSLYIHQINQTIPSSQWNLLGQFWNHRNMNTDLYIFTSTEDIQHYLNSLSNKTTSVSLISQFWWVNNTQVTFLMEGLARLPNLQTLDLSNSWNRAVYTDTIPLFKHLTSLNFSQNWHVEGSAPNTSALMIRAFANALPSSLTSLDFSGLGIGYDRGDALTQALAEGLQHLTNLRSLNLSYVGFGDSGENGPQALGKSLSSFPYLTNLDLSGNSIGYTGDLGTLALAKGLNATSQLKFLNLGDNYIGFNGTVGGEALINIMPSLIDKGLKEVNFAGNSFVNIPWGTAANALESLYSSQIKQQCEANHCFGTPIQSPTSTNTSSVQGIAISFRADRYPLEPYGPIPSSASSLRTPLIFNLFTLFRKRDPLSLPSSAFEEEPMGTDLVVYQEPHVPTLWESLQEKLGLTQTEGEPSLPGLFISSAVKGTVFTLVPEVVRETLIHKGVPRPIVHLASTATQMGMILYSSTSYLPVFAGMAVNQGLSTMGAPSSVASLGGSTAAITVTAAQGAIVTPASVVVSVGGSIVGGILALEAKETMWHEESETGAPVKTKVRSSWTYFREQIPVLIWLFVLSLFLGYV